MKSSHPLLLFTMPLWMLGCGGLTAEEQAAATDRDPLSQAQQIDNTCSALAENCDTRCTGSFENVECTGVLTGNFDNIIVPSGENCVLQDVLLTGNLVVQEDARAHLQGSSFICGNLQGDEAEDVTVNAAQICDNLQFDEGGQVHIEGTEVLKNAEFKKTDSVTVGATTICADAQFAENDTVSIPASVRVADNCSADENTNFDFSGLHVQGDNEDCVGQQ